MQVDIGLAPRVESARCFNSLTVVLQCFQAIGFKYQLAPPYSTGDICLTLHQPLASLMVFGLKRVEGRGKTVQAVGWLKEC